VGSRVVGSEVPRVGEEVGFNVVGSGVIWVGVCVGNLEGRLTVGGKEGSEVGISVGMDEGLEIVGSSDGDLVGRVVVGSSVD
jgi:hypothetical protein